MRKEERHQIKRDELVTLLERMMLYVDANQKRVAILAGVLVLAGIGGLGVRSWTSSRASSSSFLVGEMIQTYRAPITASLEDLPQAVGVRSFGSAEERDAKVLEFSDAILARYGRTAAAPKARYYRGLALSGLGRGDEARAAFQELLDRHPRDFLAPLARLQQARLLEASGRPAEALVHFQALVEDVRGVFPREEGLLGVARCQEAMGRAADALETYRRIMAEFPDSDYQFEARRKVEDLG